MNSHDSIQRLTSEFLNLHAGYQHSEVETTIRETVALLGSADDWSRIFRLTLHSLSPKTHTQESSAED